MYTKKQLIKTYTNRLCIRLLLIILTFSSTTIYSQSLTEKIGGIKTNFVIVSDTNRLKINDQAFFKRGLSKFSTEYSNYQEGGYGYGYGLQTYRLEFITTDEFNTIRGNDNKKIWYKLSLIGTDNTTLLQAYLDRTKILKYSNGSDLRTISINFQDIPLIVLDNTQVIKIEKIELKWE